MYRIYMQKLLEWKNSPDRKPLIIRGVRQCGKTWLAKEFGRLHYEDTAYLKFDEDEILESYFSPDLKPHRIIKTISLARGKDILPGKTLIIFDEIQACGKALTSLKYFQEEAPEYHIIAAGSLLGVSMPKKTSFPVGKVSFLPMYPMNFYEFLYSANNLLADYVKTCALDDSTLQTFMPELRSRLLEYYIVGGMPKVVDSWINNSSIEQVEQLQQDILDAYEIDFVKHAPIKDFPKLSAVWRAVPAQLSRENRKFMFSKVKQSWRAKDLEDALEWLIGAGLIHKVENITRPGMPLSAYANSSLFKLYLCDAGLLRRMARLPASVIINRDTYNADNAYREFKGAIAENYVLNEIISNYNELPYYWTESKAEVDFIFREEDKIVPVEVKAGSASHAQSLSQYCRKFNPEKSILTSFSDDKRNILPLPLIFRIKDWA